MLAKRQDEFQLHSCEQFRIQIPNLVSAAEGYFQALKALVNSQVGSPEEQILIPLEGAIKRLRTEFEVSKQENFVKGDNVIAFAGTAGDLYFEFIVEEAASRLKVDGTLEYKELMKTLLKIDIFGSRYVYGLNCAP
ncbi:hypothetical protein BGX23_004382, partial [Mortierella sp. AD031]